MQTQKQQHTLQLYADLMEEVKHRHRSITETLRNKSGHPGPIVRESCYLQLRMLCELIALSCLVAHGDIGLPRQLRKAYAADDMLKQLEALHPNYYPRPERREDGGPPPVKFTLVPLKDGYLTKAEVPKLVGKCGDILHRGSIKNLLARRIPLQTSFPEVEAWQKKIAALLNTHRISFLDGATHILCAMDTGPTHNVEVAIAERVSPPSG